MKEKYHCYGNKVIFNKDQCFTDSCKFYYACKIKCGVKLEMFEYKLYGLLKDISLPKWEVFELIMENYGISYNAAKLSARRWRAKSRENK